VVALLKLLCLALWILIMVFLIGGTRKTNRMKSREVTLRLKRDSDIEMAVRRAFLQLQPKDRLIIQDVSSNKNHKNRKIIDRIIKKNPAIFYFYIESNNR